MNKTLTIIENSLFMFNELDIICESTLTSDAEVEIKPISEEVQPLPVTQTITLDIDFEILARRIGSGLATSALGGVGAGIGLVFNGLLNGFSRNPSSKNELFSYAIFGFALTEAMGLFALMLAFVLLYA